MLRVGGERLQGGWVQPCRAARQRVATASSTSWNYEGGVKSTFVNDRVSLNGDVFFIQWDDMQVNACRIRSSRGSSTSPTPGIPRAQGVEFELSTRLFAGCDFFAGTGYQCRFDDGTLSNGVAVGEPDFQRAAACGRLRRPCIASAPSAAEARLFARAESRSPRRIFLRRCGTPRARTRTRSRTSAAAFAAGISSARCGSGTHSTPTTSRWRFVSGLAPSGFVGEMGAPRTFGARVGVTF